MRAAVPCGLVVGLCLASVCGVAGEARAFQCTLTDQLASIAWDSRQVVMRPSVDDGAEVTAAELRAALQHGADEWNGPACSDMQLSIGPATDERRAGFDYSAGQGSDVNQNVVVFRNETAGDPLDEWIHLGSNLAITTVTFLRSTTELLDADIEVHDAAFFFTVCDPPACQPRHDLTNTITHELGHVLGLDHPPSSQPGATTSTMFATSSEGDLAKRDIELDDEEGLCTLYPTGQPVGDCGSATVPPPPQVVVTQVGGCGATPSSSRPADNFALVLLALALPAAARRRRRRGTTHTPAARR